jgi:hypothetical protein
VDGHSANLLAPGLSEQPHETPFHFVLDEIFVQAIYLFAIYLFEDIPPMRPKNAVMYP